MSLNNDDQVRMLDTLKITEHEAFQRFWRKTDNQVQMKTVDGHCIFYDKGCTVHSGRPWRCRQWPLVDAILTDEINFNTIKASCPGFTEKASYEKICQIIESGIHMSDKN